MASFDSSDSRQGKPPADPDLRDIAHVVHEEFDGRLDPHAVDDCLGHVAARFEDASVRAFVPLLVRRYVREELHTRLQNPQ